MRRATAPTISVVKADLDDDGSLSQEAYLYALVQRAPPAMSILDNISHLQIFKGFLIFAAPDNVDGDGDDNLLSNIEVERMLDLDVVQ